VTEYAAAIGQVRPNFARAQTVSYVHGSAEGGKSFLSVILVVVGKKRVTCARLTWDCHHVGTKLSEYVVEQH